MNNTLRIAIASLLSIGAACSANATYILGHHADNAIILGSDSRTNSTSENGKFEDDECKIGVTKNGFAYTLFGSRDIRLPSNHLKLDVLATEKDVAESSVSPHEAAEKLSKMIIDVLNRMVYDPRGLQSGRFVTAIFAGYAGGVGEISVAPISYDRDKDRFIGDPVSNYTSSRKNLIFDWREEFKDLVDAGFIEDSDIQAAAADVYSLLRVIIASNRVKTIGGVPTVVVLEPNKTPRWYAKAPSCPDIGG